MNKHKEFIKKAYNGELGLTMCSEWKEVIEENYPEFKETKLEVGKWYSNYNELVFITNITNDRTFLGYGFTYESWYNDESPYIRNNFVDRFTPATRQEVQEALIKEAKRRGFSNINNSCLRLGKRPIGCNYHFQFLEYANELRIKDDYVDGNVNVIFDNGKWAEIVETITKEEAEKQLGKVIV